MSPTVKGAWVVGACTVLAGGLSVLAVYLNRPHDPTPNPNPTVYYSGKVLDLPSLHPVRNASISMEVSGPPLNAQTDSKGVFTIQVPSDWIDQVARVRIDAGSFNSAIETVVLKRNNPTGEFHIERSRVLPEQKRFLESPTYLSGYVVDEDTNYGIPEAEITIGGVSNSAMTDDSGAFRISLERVAKPGDEGPITIRVTKNGYNVLERMVAAAQDLRIQLHKK